MVSIDEIRDIPRFSGMSPQTQKWLSERSHRINASKGTFVFLEGEKCEGLFIVEKGSIRIFKSLESGREISLGIFYQGDAIGEVALIDESPYPATAVALEDSLILKLPRAEYRALLETRPDASLSIIRDLSLRIKTLSQRVLTLGSGEVEQRLALVILLFGETKKNNGEDDCLFCNLSRQELASLVGARMETVIRTVSRWYKDEIAVKSQTGLQVKRSKLTQVIQEYFKKNNSN